MKTLIHDLDNIDFLNLDNNYKIVSGDCNNCCGCFSCWVKTPLKCIHKDSVQENGMNLLLSDEVIIISKCVDGCYSSEVKRILERSISYVEPFFTLRNGEIHHATRNSKKIKLKVYFYGEMNEFDKDIARRLVLCNQKNLNTLDPIIYFYNDYKEIKL